MKIGYLPSQKILCVMLLGCHMPGHPGRIHVIVERPDEIESVFPADIAEQFPHGDDANPKRQRENCRYFC